MLKVILLSCLACACNSKRVLTPVSDATAAFQAAGERGSLAKARNAAAKMAEAPESLRTLAKELNPVVGYWNPLGLGEWSFWDADQEATVGFLRHAEIKHGRVAMAAFVGFVLQSNGVHWPGKLTGEIDYATISAAGGPCDQWDALPTASKMQIILFIGFLEWWSELTNVNAADGSAHYMRGGQPGKYPSFDLNIHPVPFNLYDPFKLNAKKSREKLDKSLLAETNNGRLAMIGIMGMLSTSKGLIVPGLDSISGIKPYSGEIMAPFSMTADSTLPYVEQMSKVVLPYVAK